MSAEGYVFPHRATVTVNDNPVSVDDKGFFSTQVQLQEGKNIIRAVATFGGQTDQYSWTYFLGDGTINPPPGQNFGDFSRFSYASQIELKAGKTGIFEILSADIRKDILMFGIPNEFTAKYWDPSKMPPEISFDISRVEAKNSAKKISLPEGVKVSIEPNGFKIYPSMVYRLELTVETSRKTPPGDYYLFVGNNLQFYEGWIKLVVTR